MDQVPFPSLTFSTQELIYILWLMRTKTILGLPERPLEMYKPDQVFILFNEAEQSLKARELMRVNSDRTVTLSEDILGLVGPCILPELSVMVIHTLDGQNPQTFYFHLSHHILAEHSIPEPGLHRFENLANLDAMKARAKGEFTAQRHDTAVDLPGFSLLENKLMEARDQLIQEGGTSPAEVLGKEPAQVAFASDLIHPLSNTSVAVIRSLGQGESTAAAFALLEGPERLWLLVEPGNNPENSAVEVRPVTSPKVDEQLENLVGAALLMQKI
jgi:hypothetical protein